MITRKAAIGFLLLAVIVFPFAYSLWIPPFVPTGKVETIEIPQYRDDSTSHQKVEYREPLIRFNTPLETAIVVTACMELFVLLCYLTLKRIEPFIANLEQQERERMGTQKNFK